MAKIGIVPMSAKPYHAGHDGLVRIASEECDEVHVYVSLSDRKRPGEVPILGTDMENIWKNYVEPSLPSNVVVEYGGSPVRKAYDEMGKANEDMSHDKFVLYSDPIDLEGNFPKKSLITYAGNLYKKKQIILRPIQRTETVDISGTKMREFLNLGDKDSFVQNLPPDVDGDAIWEILNKPVDQAPAKKPVKKAAKKVKGEALLRDFVLRLISG